MSAQVLDFTQRFAPMARTAPPAAFRRYRFSDMVRLFALERLERRTQLARLRLLATTRGLPLPLNPRQWGGQIVEGADAIWTGSEWDAAAVDAWRHRPGPPAPAMALDPRSSSGALAHDGAPPPPAASNVREAMLANARRLAGMNR